MTMLVITYASKQWYGLVSMWSMQGPREHRVVSTVPSGGSSWHLRLGGPTALMGVLGPGLVLAVQRHVVHVHIPAVACCACPHTCSGLLRTGGSNTVPCQAQYSAVPARYSAVPGPVLRCFPGSMHPGRLGGRAPWSLRGAKGVEVREAANTKPGMQGRSCR